jgi:hypothetical protein
MTEQQCGYPLPALYNQHCVNSYAVPNKLSSVRKLAQPKLKLSIFDFAQEPERKGVSGWKLSSKPLNAVPT